MKHGNAPAKANLYRDLSQLTNQQILNVPDSPLGFEYVPLNASNKEVDVSL